MGVTSSDDNNESLCCHGDYYAPVSIRNLGDMPLYLAVAWWGRLTGKIFCREDVAKTFHIDLRRAGAVLNYLTHRVEPNLITIKTSLSKDKNKRRQLSLLIINVNDIRVERKYKKISPFTFDKETREISRWLLSRPSYHDKKRFDAWKKSCPF